MKRNLIFIFLVFLVLIAACSSTPSRFDYIKQADILFINKEYAKTIALCEEGLKKYPNEKFLLGYIRDSKTEMAMLKKEEIENLYTQASSHESSEKYNEAILLYDKILQLEPNESTASNYRNLLLRRIEQIKQAELQQTIQKSFNSLIQQGDSYLAQNEFDKAIATYTQAKTLQSKSGIADDKIQKANELKSDANRIIYVKSFLAGEITVTNSEDDFEVQQLPDNTLKIINYKAGGRQDPRDWTLYYPENGIYDVNIPSTIYGLPVTVIGKNAFSISRLKNVIIPDTVVIIEEGAFSARDPYRRLGFSLENVIIGKRVKTIGRQAFYNNIEIKEIIIPDSVVSIEEEAFYHVGEHYDIKGTLSKVVLGKSLQTIGTRAFAENSIKEVNFPNSIITIGAWAFEKNRITSVILPNGIKNVLNNAFADNPIETLVIPDSLAKRTYVDGDRYSMGRMVGGIFRGVFNGTTPTRITIPANFDDEIMRHINEVGFEDGFINFWNNQNKAGGTYIKRGQIWTRE